MSGSRRSCICDAALAIGEIEGDSIDARASTGRRGPSSRVWSAFRATRGRPPRTGRTGGGAHPGDGDPRGRRCGIAELLGEFVENALYLRDGRWDVGLNHVPGQLEVDPEVLVDEDVPSARDFPPANVTPSAYRWARRAARRRSPRMMRVDRVTVCGRLRRGSAPSSRDGANSA